LQITKKNGKKKKELNKIANRKKKLLKTIKKVNAEMRKKNTGDVKQMNSLLARLVFEVIAGHSHHLITQIVKLYFKFKKSYEFTVLQKL